MKHTKYLLLCLVVSSCYKLISTFAPAEVAPGETFEVSFTVADDGSDTQDFKDDWSYAGVRVPKGWTVSVPPGAHRQYAEEWVYYPDGSKVSSAHDMEPCDKLTQFYNSVCQRSGYTWAGFKSVTKIPKNISACWRNGCDSIRLTFLITVPADVKPGRYQIDFMGGDEEDDAGIDKYSSHTEAKDSRLFHAGTAAGAYVKNRNASLARTIVVTNTTALPSIQNAEFHGHNSDAATYNPAGQRTSARQQGLYIRQGKKILKK